MNTSYNELTDNMPEDHSQTLSRLEGAPWPVVDSIIQSFKYSCRTAMELFKTLASLSLLSRRSRVRDFIAMEAQKQLDQYRLYRVLTENNFRKILVGYQGVEETEEDLVKRKKQVRDDLEGVTRLLVCGFPPDHEIENMGNIELSSLFDSMPAIVLSQSIFDGEKDRTFAISKVLQGVRGAHICVTPPPDDYGPSYYDTRGREPDAIRMIQDNSMTFHVNPASAWHFFYDLCNNDLSLKRARIIGRPGDSFYGPDWNLSGNNNFDLVIELSRISKVICQSLNESRSEDPFAIELVNPQYLVHSHFGCDAEDLIRSAVFDCEIQNTSGGLCKVYTALASLDPAWEAWNDHRPASLDRREKLIFSYSDGKETGRRHADPCKSCGYFDGY